MAQKKSHKEENNEKKVKKFKFSLDAPDAKSVFVVGDFNSWDPNSQPLKKHSKKIWKASIQLTPGRYEYRFLADGVWINDPECTDVEPNPYGSNNCVLTVQ